MKVMKVIVVKGKHFESARKEAMKAYSQHIQELAIKLKEQEAS